MFGSNSRAGELRFNLCDPRARLDNTSVASRGFGCVVSIDVDDLIQTVLDRVLTADPGGIVGVYLYGSSTTTGLGPESDVDLLLVTRRALTSQERASLVSTLLGLSGWKGHADVFPEVANRRPLEVTSLVTADLKPLVAAPWRDFQFGEWLRGDFVQGYVSEPERDPDVVILLATALASHRVLHGAALDTLVTDVPFALLKDAQLAPLPALVDDLDGEPRNVLLTLARALHTVETGAIVAKDQAAAVAARRVDPAGADLLLAAAREYLGEGQVDWDRESSQVSSLAQSLITLIQRTSAEA